jgi:outer membrane protein OmpA-like peptidoglycan-associated protein/tetratricopeptide (TPR) repeat protein
MLQMPVCPLSSYLFLEKEKHMIKLKLFCFFALYFFMTCSVAQKATDNTAAYITKKTATGKAKKHFDQGMEYTRTSANEKAMSEFSKAIKEEPTFIDAMIQLAAMYYEMERFAEAEVAFEKAIILDKAYNTKSIYVLGIAEMKQEKYAEAIAHFDEFLALEKKNEILLEKAEKFKRTGLFTQKAKANPVPFHPVSLGDKINTTDAEYLPSVTADESVLVYTRRIGNQEDFYRSKKVNGVWQAGEALDEINTDENEGAQSISADGKLLVFTACNRKDGYGSCDIYFSEMINGRWTKVANIGSAINSTAGEKQPSLSADGNTIYFASDRPGGFGEMDIWMSKRNENGVWQKPVNLGATINTKGIDRAPFIHQDGQTLYFMSDGHDGMGGHDLFYSRLENGQWGTPQNLGYPINTEADEATMVVSLDGQTAYFVSDRNKEGERGKLAEYQGKIDLDLYSFPIYEAARPQPVTYVQAKVRDAETGKNLPKAKVTVTDLATTQTHAYALTDADGEFLVCLPLGKNYSLNVNKEQYLFHSENFALDKSNSRDKPFILEIELQAIPLASTTSEVSPVNKTEGKPVVLKNVFFETGSAELKSASLVELNRLKTLLEEHPTLVIRINGHTDNIGADEDNLTLSNNRAKTVYDYLIANGIQNTRLSYKGYGETQAIADNDTPEGRQLNRRTEFVVIK